MTRVITLAVAAALSIHLAGPVVCDVLCGLFTSQGVAVTTQTAEVPSCHSINAAAAGVSIQAAESACEHQSAEPGVRSARAPEVPRALVVLSAVGPFLPGNAANAVVITSPESSPPRLRRGLVLPLRI